MLLPMLPFDDIESPLSFVARLARHHVGLKSSDFLRDLGIKPETLASSEPDALARLSEISGTPEQHLRRNAPVRVGKRLYDIRGELVTAEFLTRTHTMFCPACLQEDDHKGRRVGRWPWVMSVFRTCPDHGIALQRATHVDWDDRFLELERHVSERGDALDVLIAGSKRRSVSPLQSYVVDRLDGRPGPGWLDAQTLDQAVRATELLGVLLDFGPEQLLPALTQDDWDRAGRTGYRYTSLGEAGIRDALDQQFRKFDDDTGKPGARKIFGCFYKALAYSKSHKDPGDIARILREYLFDKLALAAGEKVFGVELPVRRLHTVSSLAEEEKLDPRSLRRVLEAAGVVPENAPSHFAIPVEAGRAVASRIQRIVHIKALPDALHCTRPVVDQFFCERLLTPIYYGSPGIRGQKQKAVDCNELAMLVGKLEAKARLVDAVGPEMVPVSKAAEKARVRTVAVLHLILGGFLNRVVRLAGEDGIAALRVDPTEVKTQAGVAWPGLLPTEAFEALRLRKDVGWRLVDRHPAEVSLADRSCTGPDPSHEIRWFSSDEVDMFKAMFTTPELLAAELGMLHSDVVRCLKERRVRPVLPRAEIGIDFYRTEDVPRDLNPVA